MEITGGDVLELLCPNTEWTIIGNDYDSIQWITCEPITKAQFDAGFAQVEKLKAEKSAKAEADKASAQAKLAALGLTADDLKALGL
jgi:hypothetical protein